jgi:hypothetical protein
MKRECKQDKTNTEQINIILCDAKINTANRNTRLPMTGKSPDDFVLYEDHFRKLQTKFGHLFKL